MCKQDRESLYERLRDQDGNIRLLAVDDLTGGKTAPGHEAMKILASRLPGETSAAVRNGIVFALQRWEEPEAYESIFNLLDLNDPQLRNAAVQIFGSYHTDAVKFLEDRYPGAPGDVRKLILDAAAATRDPAAIRIIRHGLSDPDPNVVIPAVEYVAWMKDRGSAPELLALARGNTEPMLRTAVLEALSGLGLYNEILSLYSAFRETGEDVSFYTGIVLAAMGAAGKTEELAALVREIPDPGLHAGEILEAVTTAFAAAPGSAPDNDLTGTLRAITLAGTTDPEVRYSAIELLISLTGTDPEQES